MYPLSKWSCEQICSRIHQLNANEFYREAISASNNIIFQLFVRLIKYQIAQTTKIPSSGIQGGRLIGLVSLNQRDKLLESITAPNHLRKVWDSYARQADLPDTICLFESIYGNGGWPLYAFKRKYAFHDGSAIPSGIFHSTKKMEVSGYESWQEDLTFLAKCSEKLVTGMLDQTSGIESYIGFNPFGRIPMLKVRSSNLDAYV